MSEWQPIETAPRDGSQFLALWKAPGADAPTVIIAMWSGSLGGFYGVNVQALDGHGTVSGLSDGLSGKLFATHWMPRPELPQ